MWGPRAQARRADLSPACAAEVCPAEFKPEASCLTISGIYVCGGFDGSQSIKHAEYMDVQVQLLFALCCNNCTETRVAARPIFGERCHLLQWPAAGCLGESAQGEDLTAWNMRSARGSCRSCAWQFVHSWWPRWPGSDRLKLSDGRSDGYGGSCSEPCFLRHKFLSAC